MLNRREALARIFERLDRIYALGGGDGANRPGFSAAEHEACELAASWMEEAGLEVTWDDSGNLLGRLRGEGPELPEVWTGSHLDSVPRGGKFDGPLGVLAGLEAVERIGRRERSLSVVVWRAEETGCQGSRAFVESGADRPGVFVELHIEQGPRLLRLDAPLAVVAGIVGYARGTVIFDGTAGHAGTTPMDGRDDALVEAAEFVLHARDAASGIEGAVATVGQISVEPDGANVIPSRATLSVDARAPDTGRLDRLIAAIGFEPSLRMEPAPMADEIRAVLREEVECVGVPVIELPSGAGHDAGILAAAGVPSGMLFVRSLAGGVSHSPEEESSADDIALAVDVLTAALTRLARGG
jgi:acetylornithine deacetylase/succinyl-diaminopimelate desuccinylase-like protein